LKINNPFQGTIGMQDLEMGPFLSTKGRSGNQAVSVDNLMFKSEKDIERVKVPCITGMSRDFKLGIKN
jgi:hypothetical protein